MINLKLTVLLLLLLGGSAAIAKEVPSYYKRAAHNLDIPPEVLFAVAIQESRPPTGTIRGVTQPWPWTLNCSGRPYYLNTRDQAYSYLLLLTDAGISCDIGIMQINWKWHKQRFSSLGDALDPYINITTGAKILSEQYTISRSWKGAVGGYHSPSNKGRAAIYSGKVFKHLTSLREGGVK